MDLIVNLRVERGRNHGLHALQCGIELSRRVGKLYGPNLDSAFPKFRHLGLGQRCWSDADYDVLQKVRSR